MINLLRGTIGTAKRTCHVIAMTGDIGEPQTAAKQLESLNERLYKAGEDWGESNNAVVILVDDKTPAWGAALGIAAVASEDEWPAAALLVAETPTGPQPACGPARAS